LGFIDPIGNSSQTTLTKSVKGKSLEGKISNMYFVHGYIRFQISRSNKVGQSAEEERHTTKQPFRISFAKKKNKRE
jgi:hypothetical protein